MAQIARKLPSEAKPRMVNCDLEHSLFMDKGRIRFFFVSGEETRLFRKYALSGRWQENYIFPMTYTERYYYKRHLFISNVIIFKFINVIIFRGLRKTNIFLTKRIKFTLVKTLLYTLAKSFRLRENLARTTRTWFSIYITVISRRFIHNMWYCACANKCFQNGSTFRDKVWSLNSIFS